MGLPRSARLPSLHPPVVDPETAARFAVAADELLAGEGTAVPEPRLDVTAEDFLFRDRVRYYRDGEANGISLLRA